MALETVPQTTGRVALPTWLELIEREYLTDFIQAGGAAVKFVSAPQDVLRRAHEGLDAAAHRAKFYTSDLDPSRWAPQNRKPDLHRIDRFFFEVSKGVDFAQWASHQARTWLEANGIKLRPGHALDDVDNIAENNGRDVADLLHQYNRDLATLQRDPRMAAEFRAAVTALVRAQLVPDTMSPTTEEVLLNWFRGETLPGAASALRKIRIFERVVQNNARAMLQSFCHWLPQAGFRGLVVTLDLRPYEYKKLSRPQRESQQLKRLQEAIARGVPYEQLHTMAGETEGEQAISYSETAYIQMLTLLRRFIDEIDRFERFLLVVLTSPQFYDVGAPRSYFNYDALQTRIGLEVHDARRANPTATLVHLGENA